MDAFPKFKWAFGCQLDTVKAARMLCGTYVPSKRRFDKFAQIGLEIKCPRVEECGGVQSLFGRCPIWQTNSYRGASLTDRSPEARVKRRKIELSLKKLCQRNKIGKHICLQIGAKFSRNIKKDFSPLKGKLFSCLLPVYLGSSVLAGTTLAPVWILSDKQLLVSRLPSDLWLDPWPELWVRICCESKLGWIVSAVYNSVNPLNFKTTSIQFLQLSKHFFLNCKCGWFVDIH